ncbi:MAG TPA: Crp/Fnr family transcriptional regulator [Gammaproteobacteria bacterium]|nr:Crp/Fnr family transcriptional regulator [Gammaproteobacteria bacterium]
MEMLNLNKGRKQSAELVKLFEQLDAPSRRSLLDYAQWLAERGGRRTDEAEPDAPTRPLDIPRPESESVIKAIKRLSATYPMIDRGKLFNQTSTLMTQHVMQGREAADIIDELEALFRAEFEKLEGAE